MTVPQIGQQGRVEAQGSHGTDNGTRSLAQDAAVSTSVIEPGTRLAGRYRLEDRVSEAGGSTFWKATDEILARPVAALTFEPGFPRVGAVVTAARAASRLTDPRLTQVFDADDSGEQAYVVSEWVSGETLEDLVAQGPLQPGRAAAFLMEAAEAVVCAHESGQAHLCLSPRNLVWTNGGTVKITGLGVEAVLRGATSDDPALADAEGLGRLLYAAVTGHWPGPGGETTLPPAPATDGHLCAPRQVLAGVPNALDSVVCRSLHVAGRRGQDVLATPAAFKQALSSVPRSALPFIPMASSTPPSVVPRAPRPGDTATMSAIPPATPPPTAPTPTPRTSHRSGPERGQGSGSNRTVIAIVAVVALIAVVIGGWTLSQMGGSGSPKKKAQAAIPAPKHAGSTVKVLPPAGASGISAGGTPDGRMQNDTTSVIGGRSGMWTSQHYTSNKFGRLLTGVGLRIDMGHSVSISKLHVVMPEGSPGTLQVRIGDSGDTNMALATAPDGNAIGTFDLSTGKAKGQYVLLWFTTLPNIDGQFKAQLRKVTVYGTAD
jgi:eukaryotic-like serine/threonine-protein kinase